MSDVFHLGLVVRRYRMENDLTVEGFAVSMGRTRAWLQKFERTGRCFERTLVQMYNKFPEVRKRVQEFHRNGRATVSNME